MDEGKKEMATAWVSPLRMTIVPDRESEGFRNHPEGTTGLPIGDAHPGAFGFVRKNHIHEGIDLYCPEGTSVHAVEDGVVVSVIEFTGTRAEPPSPWWHDTQAVLVEGASGVVVYGEIGVAEGIREGVSVQAGDLLGQVRQVLVKPKTPPRPMSMLHLERHRPNTRDAYEWTADGGRPASLLDPTNHLLDALVPEEARLSLSVEMDAQQSRYRLDLIDGDNTTRIGTIRRSVGGDWSWTAMLPATATAPGLSADGVAATAEIAADRQFAALEEHDPHRFRRTAPTLERIRSALEDIAARESDDARRVLDPADDEARLAAEQLRIVMPAEATLEEHLRTCGTQGIRELACAALCRLDRVYPTKR